MQLNERKLEELSTLRYHYFTCPFVKYPDVQALVVSFHGQYGYGSKGNGDAIFMTAVIKAGLAAWHTSALILDLREMVYEWGDMIGSAIDAGAGQYIKARFPTAVVISKLNRDGLTTFVEKEMGDEPSHWLFESLEDALHHVQGQYPTKSAA